MFKVHGYIDNKRVLDWRMKHLPRIGDSVRFVGKVTEIIWCMDEDDHEGTRVNMVMVADASYSIGDKT